SARCDHALVALPRGSGSATSELLLLGGVDEGRCRADVWVSRGSGLGVSWERRSEGAPWAARSGHGAVALRRARGAKKEEAENEIVLLGGAGSSSIYCDVWRSSDAGRSWELVVEEAPWKPRYGHCTLVVGGVTESTAPSDEQVIVLFAGVGLGRMLNDVWRSRDSGATWLCATRSAPWEPRAAAAAAATRRGHLVLAGGRGENGCLGDVWVSQDLGATWELSRGGPTPRSGASLLAMPSCRADRGAGKEQEEMLLLFGGFNGLRYLSDTWCSKPEGSEEKSQLGLSWEPLASQAGFEARYCHRTVVVEPNLILLLGGHGAAGAFCDVWASPAPKLWRSKAWALLLLGRRLTILQGISAEVWRDWVLPHLLPALALSPGSVGSYRRAGRF
ncbi:unnamed protein product, partial [Polarella glacialis]